MIYTCRFYHFKPYTPPSNLSKMSCKTISTNSAYPLLTTSRTTPNPPQNVASMPPALHILNSKQLSLKSEECEFPVKKTLISSHQYIINDPPQGSTVQKKPAPLSAKETTNTPPHEISSRAHQPTKQTVRPPTASPQKVFKSQRTQ